MTSELRDGGAGRYEVLLAISMDISVFASDWAYCDRLSTYVARMVSHNRADSLLYSNLLSSALNELLETVYRNHGAAGEFSCTVLRAADRDRIELKIPGESSEMAFYRQAIDRLSSPDVADDYRAALFSDGEIDPSIGLMELAVDYNAKLLIEAADAAVHLTAELILEDTVQ